MWPALTVCTDNLVFNIIVPAGAFLVAEIADTTGYFTLTATMTAPLTITTEVTLVVFQIFFTPPAGINIAATDLCIRFAALIAETVITRARIILLVAGLT